MIRPALRLSYDADARFFVSLRCQVMIVVTGRLAIKRNAREASFHGVGRRRAVAGARGPARSRSRGRQPGLWPPAVAGIRWARVNVVRSNAQMMGGVPSSPLCPLYLLRNALVPLSASAHASCGAACKRQGCSGIRAQTAVAAARQKLSSTRRHRCDAMPARRR